MMTNTRPKSKVVYVRIPESDWITFKKKLLDDSLTVQKLVLDYIKDYISTPSIDS
jgi:predicted DNA binding CopG/RHH family protein